MATNKGFISRIKILPITLESTHDEECAAQNTERNLLEDDRADSELK